MSPCLFLPSARTRLTLLGSFRPGGRRTSQKLGCSLHTYGWMGRSFYPLSEDAFLLLALVRTVKIHSPRANESFLQSQARHGTIALSVYTFVRNGAERT